LKERDFERVRKSSKELEREINGDAERERERGPNSDWVIKRNSDRRRQQD
jgi:hypothetical protein